MAEGWTTAMPGNSSSRVGALVPLCLVFLVSCGNNEPSQAGRVLDEARHAGRTAASFLAAEEDYFDDMDNGLTLTREEVRGRNTWMVWTGGNDRFWNAISTFSFGSVDFLQTLSSHPSRKVSRDNRWENLGVVNEPCFEKSID